MTDVSLECLLCIFIYIYIFLITRARVREGSLLRSITVRPTCCPESSPSFLACYPEAGPLPCRHSMPPGATPPWIISALDRFVPAREFISRPGSNSWSPSAPALPQDVPPALMPNERLTPRVALRLTSQRNLLWPPERVRGPFQPRQCIWLPALGKLSRRAVAGLPGAVRGI